MYAWLIFLGPVALWLSGAAIVGLGFAFGSEAAVAVGAVAVLLSPLLPRMQGAFEFGAQGVKGILGHEALIAETIRRGTEGGMPPEEIAAEITSEAGLSMGPAANAVADAQAEISHTLEATRANLGRRLVEERIAQGVQFEKEILSTVDRLATQHGWTVRKHPLNPNPAGVARRPDLLVQGKGKKLIIEVKLTLDRTRFVVECSKLADEVRDYQATKGFLVIPNDTTVSGDPPRAVEVVRAAKLERRLTEELG